jgi:nitroimidazol reductase NimA-like FMN-containing flavoprotein (pyridoxamine 5'-phosphate oxidase superfamily)
MIEILEIPIEEVESLLMRVGFGHFGCSLEGQPYVVPINYAYDKQYLYIYTTAGLKTEILKRNPLVCLQVEEFEETGTWRSVVVTGEATPIHDRAEREKAVELIRSSNPTLLPALAIKWTDNWIRENIEVVYRIKILTASGRSGSEVSRAAASARPAGIPAPL